MARLMCALCPNTAAARKPWITRQIDLESKGLQSQVWKHALSCAKTLVTKDLKKCKHSSPSPYREMFVPKWNSCSNFATVEFNTSVCKLGDSTYDWNTIRHWYRGLRTRVAHNDRRIIKKRSCLLLVSRFDGQRWMVHTWGFRCEIPKSSISAPYI